jgi:hypothetical protein
MFVGVNIFRDYCWHYNFLNEAMLSYPVLVLPE